MMHRRAGGDFAPRRDKHADAHKFCESFSCGVRQRPQFPLPDPKGVRSKKITAWRKGKAKANRRYLEEHVYAKP